VLWCFLDSLEDVSWRFIELEKRWDMVDGVCGGTMALEKVYTPTLGHGFLFYEMVFFKY